MHTTTPTPSDTRMQSELSMVFSTANIDTILSFDTDFDGVVDRTEI